jgi:hypothetical protein
MGVIGVDEHVKIGWRNGSDEIRSKITICVLFSIS